MNAIVAPSPHAGDVAHLPVRHESVRRALQTSIYPGASDASVDMVLAYCEAARLDPMMKPVHIVPMSVGTGRKDSNGWEIKETRDVVMPGIGLYRTNAARTTQYAGCSEPEFGPTRTLHYKREIWEDRPGGNGRQKRLEDATLEYPEWCRITVRKLLGNSVVEFTAKEYWIENYATKNASSDAPNAMWAKRPFAQLAKCTEAQGLRKAFPEAVGSQPTAEEMEGKGDYIDVESVRVDTSAGSGGSDDLTPRAKPAQSSPIEGAATREASKPAAAAATARAAIAPGIDLTDSQKRMLLVKAKQAGLMDEAAVLAKFPAISIVNMNEVIAQMRALADANDGAGG